VNLVAFQLKEQLTECFVGRSKQASYQRHMDESLGKLYAEELKARAYLFREAGDLVKGLCANGSALDFEREVQQAFASKIADNDWGWGSNWPDHVHALVIREIYDIIIDFFKK